MEDNLYILSNAFDSPRGVAMARIKGQCASSTDCGEKWPVKFAL